MDPEGRDRGAPDHFRKPRKCPRLACVRPYPSGFEVPDDRRPRLVCEDATRRLADDGGLVLVDHKRPVHLLVSVRPEVVRLPFTLLCLLPHRVANLLAKEGRVELRAVDPVVEILPVLRPAQVDVGRQREEQAVEANGLMEVHNPASVLHLAKQTLDLPTQDCIDPTQLNVRKQALEVFAPHTRVPTGLTEVLVLGDDLPALLLSPLPARRKLNRDGTRVILLGLGHSRVDANLHDPDYRDRRPRRLATQTEEEGSFADVTSVTDGSFNKDSIGPNPTTSSETSFTMRLSSRCGSNAPRSRSRSSASARTRTRRSAGGALASPLASIRTRSWSRTSRRKVRNVSVATRASDRVGTAGASYDVTGP